MDYLPKIINDLKNLPENKFCADCNLQESLYVSINNGVFLCYICADYQNSFGKQVSYLKNLGDAFDEYLILYLIRGGNKKFKLYLNEMGMDHISGQHAKIYLSRALDNYRQILKSEVLGEEPPDFVDEKSRMELIPLEQIPIAFPEFEDYIIEPSDEIPKGFVDKAMNILDSVYFTSLHYKERAKLNLKESEIIDKIKSGTKVSYENVKKFGKNVIAKSKPIINDMKLKAINGFENVKDKAKNFFGNIFKKEENPENYSYYHSIDGNNSNETNIEKFIKMDDLNRDNYKIISESLNLKNDYHEVPAPDDSRNNDSIRASQMEIMQEKFHQNLLGPQSFSVFGDSTYEPQAPMPFLKEIEEHENIPKITLNPDNKEEQHTKTEKNSSLEILKQLVNDEK